MPQPFSLVDNHVVLDLGGRAALLDTGSPHPFGRCGEVCLPWGGTPAIPRADPAGRSIEEITRAMRAVATGPTGPELDLVLGCDLLRGRRLLLDWARRELEVLAAPRGARHLHGVPSWEITLDGAGVEAIVDTGARLSYARPHLVGRPIPGAAIRDFDFLSGRHQEHDVPLAECVVALGAHRLQTRIGLAGGAVEAALKAAGAGAIVGVDLLVRTGTTEIDLPG